MGYAVLHLEKAKGADGAMSTHIERTVHPKNADRTRTHLNRELVQFPEGVRNRTQAIAHRIETAGIKRKIGTNQVRAIRVLLTGSNEDMKRMEEDGRLDGWCSDNLKWLRETYGERNLVSAVLHMDEKTPHIHATIVPIVTGERRKARQDEQNGKKKYRKKNTQDVRLCADDVMARHKLKHYQGTSHEQVRLAERRGRFAGKAHTDLAILQGTGGTAGQPAGEHRKPAGAGRGSAEEAEKGQGGNQRAEDEGCGGERNHSHSGRGEFSFGRQQGQEAGSGERKFEAGHCGSAKAGTSRTEGADKNGEPPQQRDKQDRPELPAKNQGIRQQTGTDRHLFPYREGIVAHSRTMPGSGVYRGTDKAGCQPATRGVQGKALFEGTQGEVQDGALDGNRGEEPAGEREIPAVH